MSKKDKYIKRLDKIEERLEKIERDLDWIIQYVLKKDRPISPPPYVPTTPSMIKKHVRNVV